MARKSVKKERAKIQIIQNIILAVFIIFCVFFSVNRAVWFLQNAEVFEIKEIIRDPALAFIQSAVLENCKGKNIFAVDLRFLQNRLQTQFPEVDKLRVVRKFPDAIILSARKRDPFALLMTGNKDMLLDREGYVLSFSPVPSSRYPAIVGCRLQGEPVLGKPVREAAAQKALGIIEELGRTPALAAWPPVQVDVGNFSQINLVLSGGLKVIMDSENVPHKVKTLEILLKQGGIEFKDVNYIDLRLRDPVISYVNNEDLQVKKNQP